MVRHPSNDTLTTDVAFRFQLLVVGYLMQTTAAVFTQGYQVFAIFFFKDLLRYRFYVSRLNKLVILFGALLLIMTHVWRLDKEGHLCSGDHLTDLQREDPAIRNNYLIEMGKILMIYMNIIWGIIGASILVGCTAVALFYAAFS